MLVGLYMWVYSHIVPNYIKISCMIVMATMVVMLFACHTIQENR